MRYLLTTTDLRPNVGVGRVQGAARREAAKDVQVKLGRVTKKLQAGELWLFKKTSPRKHNDLKENYGLSSNALFRPKWFAQVAHEQEVPGSIPAVFMFL